MSLSPSARRRSPRPPAPRQPPRRRARQTGDDGGRHPSPAGAKVYIVSPANGATVPLTTTVRFGLSIWGSRRPGVEKANSGHHHLMIDAPLPPFDEPIPNDANHLHFGAGQTEATITLTPGKHTLQLLLGDANHVPHEPPVFSEPITVMAGDVAAAQPAAQHRPARRVVHHKRYWPRYPVDYRYPHHYGHDAYEPEPTGPYAGQGGASMYHHPDHP